MGHTERWSQTDGKRIGVRERGRPVDVEGGITFVEDLADLGDPVKVVGDGNLDRLAGRHTMDFKTFSQKIDEFLRELVASTINASDAQNRVSREIERRVEVACKASQGLLERLVTSEIERQVRCKVAEAVSAISLNISVRGTHGKEAKDGQALSE